MKDYLIHSKACDGMEMLVNKSMEACDVSHSGWVGCDEHFKLSDEVLYLRSTVRPSQAISKDDRKPFALLKSDGKILTGGCTCMAREGRGCSDVAALLFKVHVATEKGLCGVSCTDGENSWNRGTKRNVEPSLMSSMNFKSRCIDSPDDDDSSHCATAATSRFSQFLGHDEHLNYVHIDPLLSSMTMPGTMFSTIMSKSITPAPITVNGLRNCAHEEHDSVLNVESDPLPSCTICRELYEKFMKLSPGRAAQLTSATQEQSWGKKRKLWMDSRRLKITSSVAKSVPKRDTTDPKKWISSHLYGSLKGNSATRYGTENESKARSIYEDITGHSVTSSGLVTDPIDDWLAASAMAL